MTDFLQVGPYRFTVVPGEPPADRGEAHGENGDEFVYGHTDFPTQRILINPSQGTDSFVETILHEVLHCCFYMCAASNLDEEMEEEIVSMLSPILLDTLRRNPALVQWLLDGRVLAESENVVELHTRER